MHLHHHEYGKQLVAERVARAERARRKREAERHSAELRAQARDARRAARRAEREARRSTRRLRRTAEPDVLDLTDELERSRR